LALLEKKKQTDFFSLMAERVPMGLTEKNNSIDMVD